MRETIYVKLLDEGIDVWRPVVAERVKNGTTFYILPSPDNKQHEGENWEFSPGSHVLVKEAFFEGQKSKVAYTLAEN
jgi:hypothetical protein